MNFDFPGLNNLDFTPAGPPIDMLASLSAESAIINAIVQGSGGPDNAEWTDAGLRFVRHLLSISGSARRGVIPNFKNVEIVQEMARQFIRQCGGGTLAMQVLASIMQERAD
ncbi:MAG: hypothetical protein C5B53_10970 [Candidatus Melainabacteria bacterium]|nr:MAG: hypothetical protein C5B53_10970 [Candidatus Melainabacteria bacterium]